MSEFRVQLIELHDKQQGIVDNAARFNVLNCGRRFGKNILLHERVATALVSGQLVGWMSPTYKNMGDDWRTLVDILAPITSSKHEQDRRIECITGGALEMWTMEHPDPIRGHRYHRAILNEAAHAPYLMASWNKIIRATLADFKGDAWLASTPNGLNDWHTMYAFGASHPEWRSWTFTTYDNPYIDPAEIDSIRASTPEREFRQEYLAEFVQNEGAVFRNLGAALTAPLQLPEEHKDHTIVGGVDWGKSNDFTVMSLGCVDCGREAALDRFNQIDYTFQIDRLETMHKQWDVRRWRVELNSIGVPLFEQLQRRGLPVVGFQTTLTSKQPLIEGFALAIERGEITLLPDEAGRSELQAYEVTRTETGMSKYGAPAGMHDDTVIARALMYQQMRETQPETRRKERREKQQRAMSEFRKVF